MCSNFHAGTPSHAAAELTWALVLAAARQHGLRVPQDLLVACVSEDPEYATTTPPVTTLSLRPDRLGEEGIDLLIAVINARSGVDRHRLVQPVLTSRCPTG